MEKPFAYFQWNSGWDIWEEVDAGSRDRAGVIAAYVAAGVDRAALPSAQPDVVAKRARLSAMFTEIDIEGNG